MVFRLVVVIVVVAVVVSVVVAVVVVVVVPLTPGMSKALPVCHVGSYRWSNCFFYTSLQLYAMRSAIRPTTLLIRTVCVPGLLIPPPCFS